MLTFRDVVVSYSLCSVTNNLLEVHLCFGCDLSHQYHYVIFRCTLWKSQQKAVYATSAILQLYSLASLAEVQCFQMYCNSLHNTIVLYTSLVYFHKSCAPTWRTSILCDTDVVRFGEHLRYVYRKLTHL